MANDLSTNPLEIDTAATALIGGGPYVIYKIVWYDPADGEDLTISTDAAGNDVFLIAKCTAAVDGLQMQWDFPYGHRLKDFAVPVLDGGLLYVYFQRG